MFSSVFPLVLKPSACSQTWDLHFKSLHVVIFIIIFIKHSGKWFSLHGNPLSWVENRRIWCLNAATGREHAVTGGAEGGGCCSTSIGSPTRFFCFIFGRWRVRNRTAAEWKGSTAWKRRPLQTPELPQRVCSNRRRQLPEPPWPESILSPRLCNPGCCSKSPLFLLLHYAICFRSLISCYKVRSIRGRHTVSSSIKVTGRRGFSLLREGRREETRRLFLEPHSWPTSL